MAKNLRKVEENKNSLVIAEFKKNFKENKTVSDIF
jgi:hypothetical protein